MVSLDLLDTAEISNLKRKGTAFHGPRKRHEVCLVISLLTRDNLDSGRNWCAVAKLPLVVVEAGLCPGGPEARLDLCR